MDTSEDGELSSDMYCPFELPDEEYGEMMFDRRLAMESSTSPVSRPAESRRGSTVADTDGKFFQLLFLFFISLKLTAPVVIEPRSSPAPSRGRKSNRPSRPSTRGTRSSKLQAEISSQGKASDDDGESGEDTGANDEGDEEGEEGSGESEGDEEAEDEKGSRSTRAQASRSKPKDKKPATGTTTRRTGRRR